MEIEKILLFKNPPRPEDSYIYRITTKLLLITTFLFDTFAIVLRGSAFSSRWISQRCENPVRDFQNTVLSSGYTENIPKIKQSLCPNEKLKSKPNPPYIQSRPGNLETESDSRKRQGLKGWRGRGRVVLKPTISIHITLLRGFLTNEKKSFFFRKLEGKSRKNLHDPRALQSFTRGRQEGEVGGGGAQVFPLRSPKRISNPFYRFACLCGSEQPEVKHGAGP
ncbi:hypothetical protein CEXT_269721 [Caerostris extrusa]|uniref:Uncharacterized protein n=1 Tax=Caerostris extrusa TaxID=172846 RepID=A0AAV4PIE1_CAEEX|nr:hypothetical protein CEXT_269721 [Caerostris extrusa]